jgi:hypothetical protein
VLSDEQMVEAKRREDELHKERSSLTGYPELTGEALVYWIRAEEAFGEMTRARSDRLRSLANRIGAQALELWDDVPARDRVLFCIPQECDPHTGRPGIDNLEWELPRLKSLRENRPELDNPRRIAQMEILAEAIAEAQPPAPPDEQENPASRIREIVRKLND